MRTRFVSSAFDIDGVKLVRPPPPPPPIQLFYCILSCVSFLTFSVALLWQAAVITAVCLSPITKMSLGDSLQAGIILSQVPQGSQPFLSLKDTTFLSHHVAFFLSFLID